MTGPAASASRKGLVVQGEYQVSGEPDLVLMTLLGSCVAACLHDPHALVGGMNHFLLPGEDRAFARDEAERYGAYLMELLINGLMQLGASRNRMQAKLFGGARVVPGLSDVGRKNAAFAERFLKREGIALIGSDLGGGKGRRLQFWPASGRARRSFIEGEAIVSVERARPQALVPSGDVELFGDDPPPTRKRSAQ